MNCLRFVLALLASASVISTASHPSCDIRVLSQTDLDGLTEVVREADSPDAISAILGDCDRRIRGNSFLLDLLDTMIQRDRTRSFLLLFPCADFSGGHLEHLWVLFMEAFIKYNYDLCDYLLYQNFPIEKALFPMWNRSSVWHIDDLKTLASSHPERIPELIPPAPILTVCPHADSLVSMVEFIDHGFSVSGALASNPGYHPTQLLGHIIENRGLEDVGMVRLLQRLLGMGAVVDQAKLDAIGRIHPNCVEPIQVLLEAATPDVKEPC
jgi:hypothetical protein